MRQGISLLLLTIVISTVFGAHANDKPNIILIFADDLGYGDLASYGHSLHKTPRLDRMAREGARLTDFYVPMPYCAPSRASILTGRYPFRHGIVHNPTPDQSINDLGIADEEITLAEALKDRGYATICIGKWHLGHKPRFMPTRHGFDEYFGILYSNDMRPVDLREGEERLEYPVLQADLTKRYTERAMSFIEKHRDQPFFVYLPHAMPHKPLAASEKFYKTTPTLYGDVMAELDASVGEILDKLAELKLDEKTLVIFTSDNGPWYGGSTGGLRGMKGRPWEGGIRVPMIARWPGRIPAGLVSGEVAGTIDLFPTLLKLAGGSLPSDRVMDGRDILPLLSQPGAKSPHEALLAMSGENLQTIRSGPWKLHVRSPGPDVFLPPDRPWTDPRGPDGVTILAPFEQPQPDEHPGITGGAGPAEMMLFHLADDPAEQRNVAAEHPEIVARLRGYYDELQKQVKPIERHRGGPLLAPGPRPAKPQ